MIQLSAYYPTDSFWQRVDPRVKIFFVFMITFLAVATTGWRLLFVLLLTCALYFTAGLSGRVIQNGLRPFRWFLIFTFLLNCLFPFAVAGLGHVFIQRLPESFLLVFRLIVILLAGFWISHVTRPQCLTEAMAKLFRFLLPPKTLWKFIFVIRLAMRFLPELVEEWDHLIIAQRIRGVRLRWRLRDLRFWFHSSIIPVFLLSFRKAAAVAIAINARGYSLGDPLVSFNELQLTRIDYLLLLGFTTLGAVLLWIR